MSAISGLAKAKVHRPRPAYPVSVPARKPELTKPPIIPAPDWLPPDAPARKQILSDLALKTNQPPYDGILRLLLIAQTYLQMPALAARRDGIETAYDAALVSETRANDHALSARIFDAFLLPFIPAAHPEAAYQTSRQSLMKAAFGVYQETHQQDKEIDALTLLRYWSADDNTHDWACVQLAPLYVARQDYGKAIYRLWKRYGRPA